MENVGVWRSASRGQRMKTGVPVVNPDAVRGVEIVGDVNVRSKVAVQIAKGHSQSPISGWSWQWPLLLIDERPAGPRELGEAAVAVVEIDQIRLAALEDQAFGRVLEVVALCGRDDAFAADVQNGETRAPDGRRPVIGDIEIKIAISIQIA